MVVTLQSLLLHVGAQILLRRLPVAHGSGNLDVGLGKTVSDLSYAFQVRLLLRCAVVQSRLLDSSSHGVLQSVVHHQLIDS